MAVKNLSKKPLIVIAALAILAIAVIPSYYFYTQYQKTQSLLKNPTEAAKEEVKVLVDKVSALIELPKEEPTVATVSDKTKLSDQPFFQRAENGDKVLIYTQAKKAILYRPSTNKIVEVAPVNLGQPQEASGTSSAQTQAVRVAIYNGTGVTGLTKTAETRVTVSVKNIEVVERSNASKKDYEKSLVVAISNAGSQKTAEIAKVVGGEVGKLPEGEAKPDADILVILGSDYTK